MGRRQNRGRHVESFAKRKPSIDITHSDIPSSQCMDDDRGGRVEMDEIRPSRARNRCQPYRLAFRWNWPRRRTTCPRPA
jgi:hypothetical protein